MKIYLKLILPAFIVALSTLVISCSDFLTETLPNEFDSNNYYRNVEESAQGLYGLYGKVKDAMFGSDFYSLTDIMCDDMDFRGTDASRKQLSSLYFSETNKYFTNMWAKFYAVVNNANLIIENVPNTEALTSTAQTDRDIIIAEAKFIRAWAYFNLIQLWGEVPLITKPTISIREDIRPKRASIDDITTLILTDLEDAKVIPASPYTVLIRGRIDTGIKYDLAITQGAVRLLKAKVYLYQKDYQNCLSAIQYIIDRYDENGTKPYQLVQDYSKLFDVRYKRDADRLKEVIWEIEALDKSGYNNTKHRDFAPSNSISASKSEGYQNYIPTTSLFDAFSKQPSDKRFSATYRISGSYPCIIKHVDVMATDQNTAGPNEVLMRVGDALLIYAEALNKTGQREEAIEWLNKIRKRAGLIRQVGPLVIGDIKANTPSEVVNDTILFERRLELAHEGQRLFDLRRTGKLMKAIELYNNQAQQYRSIKTKTFNVSTDITGNKETAITLGVPFTEIVKNTDIRFLLHPIPTDEIRSNVNLLPNNNGYN